MGKEEDLLDAAGKGDFDKVEKLLNKDSKKKKKDEDAAEPTKEKVVVTHLKINCREMVTAGHTPLMLASLNGFTEIVEILLWHSAETNLKDSKKNTALHLAAWSGKTEIVDLLLNFGAKINEKCATGDTALHYAAQFGHRFVIHRLLKAGADPMEANAAGETPLDVAARFDKRDCVSLLLDNDARVVACTRSLREAAKTGRNEIVAILLDAGMDPNDIDASTGSTALHEAARYFRKDAARLLLEYGADMLLKNSAGESALGIVEQYHKLKENDIYPLFKERYGKAATKHKRISVMPLAPVVVDPTTKVAPKSVVAPMKSRGRWTQNNDQFRNIAIAGHAPSNLLIDDPKKFWQIPSAQRNWIVFDFGTPHVITGIRLCGWSNAAMVREFQFDHAESLSGPWDTALVATAEKVGPESLSEPGVAQDFVGSFAATARYWRLFVRTNHGSFNTALHKVQFFGADKGLIEWLEGLGAAQYLESFVQHGFSELSDVPFLLDSDIASCVSLPGHRKKVSIAVKEQKDKSVVLQSISFSVPPVFETREHSVLPPFTAIGSAGCEDELELVAHGDPAIEGTLIRRLVNKGSRPSEATFDDIKLSPAGNYLLEVRAVHNVDIFVQQQAPIVVGFELKQNTQLDAMFGDLDSMLKFD
eukprot:Opistho-2@47512